MRSWELKVNRGHCSYIDIKLYVTRLLKMYEKSDFQLESHLTDMSHC